MDRIAIYGFGRIGRQCAKIALNNGLFFPAALADVKDAETLAALFAVDKPVKDRGDAWTAAENIIPDAPGAARQRRGFATHLAEGAAFLADWAAAEARPPDTPVVEVV